jgi:hypothetical protein
MELGNLNPPREINVGSKFLLGSHYPALDPLGTGISGIARQGLILSAYPISNSIPWESSPAIFFSGKFRIKSACFPSISVGNSRFYSSSYL